MGRFTFIVGKKSFRSKTNALQFYKDILNRYQFGEALSREDAKEIIMLACKDDFDPDELVDFSENCFATLDTAAVEALSSIIVDRHPDFRATKCFYFMWTGVDGTEKEIFSYRQAINGLPSNQEKFSRACRFCIRDRLRAFKIQQFKNRPVRCAVSNKVVEWEQCQIDHKSPLTFSVIVKSFIVSHQIDIENIAYSYQNSQEIFVDQQIADQFYSFHNQMAVLRILSTQENIKRSGGARIIPSKKDSILSTDGCILP